MLIRSLLVLCVALPLTAADAAPKKSSKTPSASKSKAKAKAKSKSKAKAKSKAKPRPKPKSRSKPRPRPKARAEAARARGARARGARARARTTRKRARRTHQQARCRDIFCTAQIVRMDGSGEKKGLSEEQVEKVASRAQKPLEPCLVHARRRDPDAVKARVEVVVDRRGRILASRVNGKRRGTLARCVRRKLRGVRFPRSELRRQVAAFTIAIPD